MRTHRTHERDRASAITQAMMYGRHSREDAEAIVKTEAEMDAMHAAQGGKP